MTGPADGFVSVENDPLRPWAIQLFCVARFLFNHLVDNGEHAGWNVEAERLGGLEVDDEFELGRLLDRQVGGLFALENPPNIDAGLAPGVLAGAVTHQTAEVWVLTAIVNRRYPMTGGQRRELFAL